MDSNSKRSKENLQSGDKVYNNVKFINLVKFVKWKKNIETNREVGDIIGIGEAAVSVYYNNERPVSEKSYKKYLQKAGVDENEISLMLRFGKNVDSEMAGMTLNEPETKYMTYRDQVTNALDLILDKLEKQTDFLSTIKISIDTITENISKQKTDE